MKITARPQFLVFWLLVLLPTVLSIVDAVAFKRLTFFPGSDLWEHVAAVHAWSQDLVSPVNSQVASDEPTSRYMPYFLLVSSAASIFDLSPMSSLYIFGVINVLLFCICWGSFLRVYFDSDWAPAVGLLTFFFCWGLSWHWSNVYSIWHFPTLGSYPSSFAMWVTPLLWTLCLSEKYRDHLFRRRLLLLSIGLLTFIVVLTHVLTAILAVSGAGLLVILRLDLNWRNKLVMLTVISMGALLTLLWPYYDIIDLVTSGSSGSTTGGAPELYGLERAQQVWQHPFYRPVSMVAAIGPAAAGLIALAWLLYQRSRWFLTLGSCFFGLAYVTNMFYSLPLGHRYLLFLIVFFHLAIVAVLVHPKRHSQHQRSLLWRVCAVSVALGVVLNVRLVAQSLFIDVTRNEPSISDVYGALAKDLPENTVVLAKPRTAWPAPAFGVKIVGLYHSNPLIRDLPERNRDNLAFFDEHATDEQRIQLIEKYGVTHILLDDQSSERMLLNFLSQYTRVKSQVGEFKLFKMANEL